MRRLTALLLFPLALTAQAEVYKCKQADGSIGYQSRPCEGAATLKTLKNDKSTGDEESKRRLREQVSAAEQHFATKAKQEEAATVDRLDRAMRKRDVEAKERDAAATERLADIEEARLRAGARR